MSNTKAEWKTVRKEYKIAMTRLRKLAVPAGVLLLTAGFGLALNRPARVAQAASDGASVRPEATAAIEPAAGSTHVVFLPLIGRNMCKASYLEIEPNDDQAHAQCYMFDSPGVLAAFDAGNPDYFRVFVDRAGTLDVRLFMQESNYSAMIAVYGPGEAGGKLAETYTPVSGQGTNYQLTVPITQTGYDYYVLVASSVSGVYSFAMMLLS